MIVRIVKMNFRPEEVDVFLNQFEKVKQEIRNFEGNSFLELYQEPARPTCFFTYSYWDSEEDLEKYRNSDFFKEVWQQTKILFQEKPQAWSLIKQVSLP